MMVRLVGMETKVTQEGLVNVLTDLSLTTFDRSNLFLGPQGPRGQQGEAGRCPDCMYPQSYYPYQFQQQSKGPSGDFKG